MAIIGISPCRKLEDYRQAVLHVGGEPRVLDLSMSIEQALAGIDGLLLTGGDDVEPARYGETPHPTVKEAEPGRDEFEIGLITAARARQLPIFAICRGVQVLNVARGGTLIQHLPDAVGHGRHAPDPVRAGEHQVRIEAGSRLGLMLGPQAQVPAGHHQAVQRLGSGLSAVAWADDGVVEAVVLDGHPFGIGVQWHPEEGADMRIFDELSAAAAGAHRALAHAVP